jgi:hypothetical protein
MNREIKKLLSHKGSAGEEKEWGNRGYHNRTFRKVPGAAFDSGKSPS